MTDDIKFSSIVGDKTLDNGGYFGDLMEVLSAHIDDAIEAQRITQAEAGQIYTGVIPSMIQQAVQFELNKEQANKNIAKTLLESSIVYEHEARKVKQNINSEVLTELLLKAEV